MQGIWKVSARQKPHWHNWACTLNMLNVCVRVFAYVHTYVHVHTRVQVYTHVCDECAYNVACRAQDALQTVAVGPAGNSLP